MASLLPDATPKEEWSVSQYIWEPCQLLPQRRKDGGMTGQGLAAEQQQQQQQQRQQGRRRVATGRTAKAPAACQVCSVSLAGEKFYYRRYRICREHASLEERAIKGRLVQWCQQCGHFQPKEEFKPGRKSCLRSLERQAAAVFLSRREAAAAEASSSRGSSQGSPGNDAGGSGTGTHSLLAAEASASGSGSGGWGEPAETLPTLEELLEADPSLIACLGLAPDGSSAAPAEAARPDSVLPSAAGHAHVQGAQPLAQLLCTNEGGLMANLSAPRYISANRLLRFSMKLFDTVPEMLPPNLLSEVKAMLDAGDCMLEGYIRPGCVELTLDVLLAGGPAADSLLRSSVLDLALRFLSREPLAGVTPRMQMHVHGDIALVKGGEVASVVTTDPEGKGSFFPQLFSVSPLAAMCGEDCKLSLDIQASGLGDSSDSILCGSGGHYLPAAGGTAHAPAGTHSLSVDMSGLDERVGALRLEGRRGALMSNTLSVLMMPCAASAAEVCELEGAKGHAVADVPAFLYEMGLVLRSGAQPRGDSGAASTSQPSLRPAAASQLAAFAVSMQWVHVTRILLPFTVATGRTPTEAVADMDASLPDGRSVLATAVESGSVALVQVLMEWGQQVAYSWPIDQIWDYLDEEVQPEMVEVLSEGVDFSSAEKAPGPSLPAGTCLAGLSKPRTQAGGGSGPLGTRQEFVAAFHRQQLWREVVFEATHVLLCSVLVVRMWREGGWSSLAYLLGSLMVNILPGLAIMLLAYRGSPAFIRWRTPCVVALRTLRSYAAFVSASNYYNRYPAHSTALPTELVRLAFHLLRMPLVSLKGAVGHTLPLFSNVLNVLSFIAPYWLYIDGRYSCLAISGWLMLLVGAVLPVWVLGLMEAQAWRRWQRRPLLSNAALALNVCGMALASAACLLLAEQAALRLGV